MAKLLVVDDDPGIVKLLETVLARDHDVVTAPDGSQAVQLLSRDTYDGVLCDHMMPGLTGVEVLQRAFELCPGAARVLITASENITDARDAINLARVHRFIVKPFRTLEISATIKGLLREVALERENAELVEKLCEKNAQLQAALLEVREHEAKLEAEVERQTAELRAANAELEKLALLDGLTGLYNHRFLQEALTTELARSQRYQRNVALVFLDVDQFKNYNDALGHQAGDALLRELARILSDTGNIEEMRFRGRASDIAARYGGEEFVLILPETDRAGALVRAERLRVTVEEYPFDREEVQPGGKITVSIGVASYPEDAASKEDLIEAADQAMLEAKRTGRNRVLGPGTATG